ncbi:MAG: hypothetical protein K8R11_00350, partial [Methanococcoides sp.]|nr:hypothetical protein [Methanococcoides sp.]
MKKKVTGLATFVFMLLFLTQAQAEIIWQDDTVFNYGISKNGGTFYYPGVVPNPNNPDTYNWPNDGTKLPAYTIGETASASTQESFNPDGQAIRGSTVLYATSSGGVVTDGLGGLQNKAQTSILITGESGGVGLFNADENGIDVQQTVISSLQKRFSVDEDTSVYFRGFLDGAVDFAAFENPDNSSHYANYNLAGSAQISQIVDDGAGVQTTLPPISLNNDNREGEHLIQLVKEIEGKDVEYVLSTSLSLQTDVQNWRHWVAGIPAPPYIEHHYESYELSGPFLLGIDPDNPLIMTATLNQVPIPPSLLLMGSGLGGLFVIRRRF